MNSKEAARLSAQEWSTYWKNGTVTTFDGIFKNNYDGEVKQFWQQIFSTLPYQATLLDLATGNGALALLAAQLCGNKDIHIDAIDFADIRPPQQGTWGKLSKKVNFHSQVAIENTQITSKSIDCAVSQFGVEYAELDLALAEVNRICKKSSSRFAAILHHTDSMIFKQAKQSVEQIQLCENSLLLDTATRLLNKLDKLNQMGESPKNDHDCEKLRQKFNHSAAQLLEAAEHFNDPGHIRFFLENISVLFNPQTLRAKNFTEQQTSIHFIQNESRAFNARMSDLLNAACDDKKMKVVSNRLHSYGFKIKRCEPLFYNSELFSWALVAER